ncbi:hypothetical protein BaRGS_00010202, partial [Batillaria attramentaria]
NPLYLTAHVAHVTRCIEELLYLLSFPPSLVRRKSQRRLPADEVSEPDDLSLIGSRSVICGRQDKVGSIVKTPHSRGSTFWLVRTLDFPSQDQCWRIVKTPHSRGSTFWLVRTLDFPSQSCQCLFGQNPGRGCLPMIRVHQGPGGSVRGVILPDGLNVFSSMLLAGW